MSIKYRLPGTRTAARRRCSTSSRARPDMGNWPGVTVEKKEGKLKGHKEVIIQDLPGIYSLSPYSLEEVIARSYLVSEKPDAIINIVDGTISSETSI